MGRHSCLHHIALFLFLNHCGFGVLSCDSGNSHFGQRCGVRIHADVQCNYLITGGYLSCYHCVPVTDVLNGKIILSFRKPKGIIAVNVCCRSIVAGIGHDRRAYQRLVSAAVIHRSFYYAGFHVGIASDEGDKCKT